MLAPALAIFTGVLESSPECTVPVILSGLKIHQFRPCLTGTDAALATMLIVNGSPASFSESAPLVCGVANVPAAVKVTFGAVSGTAPLNPQAAKHTIATNNVAGLTAFTQTLFGNIRLLPL